MAGRRQTATRVRQHTQKSLDVVAQEVRHDPQDQAVAQNLESWDGQEHNLERKGANNPGEENPKTLSHVPASRKFKVPIHPRVVLVDDMVKIRFEQGVSLGIDLEVSSMIVDPPGVRIEGRVKHLCQQVSGEHSQQSLKPPVH